MASATEILKKAELATFIQSLPQNLRDELIAEVMNDEKSIQPYPYYSTFRFGAQRVGAGPYTYTVQPTQVSAFGYKVGDDAGGAGMPGLIATKAETNLVSGGSQTNDTSDFVFDSIGFEVCPSEFFSPELLLRLARNLFAEISLSGSSLQTVGPITDYPHGGGFYGQAAAKLTCSAADVNASEWVSHLEIGYPSAGAARKLKSPVRWYATGKGKDSSLKLNITNARTIVLNAADITVGADTFVPPAEIAVDVRVHLYGMQVSQRSGNI